MNMMRFGCAALTMILLTINGCVELTGQRLSWRYDAEKDELTALLFYDGIHNTKDDDTNTPEKLAAFIKNGDIMLGDWFGYIFLPAKMREELDKPDSNLSPTVRKLNEQALKSVHAHAIGYYRDAAGQIGAVQSITISDASKLVAAFNAWMNEQQADQDVDTHSSTFRTERLMHKAAKKHHQWLTLDGNSIVLTMPVDRGEWAKLKADFFTDGMSNWGKDDNNQLKDENHKNPDKQLSQVQNSIRWMTQFLTSVPVSYTEQGGIVTIRLGDPTTSNTVRYRIHNQYTDNLVEPVKRNIPDDLNAMLAKYLLADKPEKNADLDAIIAFGPPEQQVMALIGAARGDDAATAEKVAAKLQSWAAKWNSEQSYPQAPAEMPTTADTPPAPDTASYFKQWDAWLKRMASYPVDAAPAPGASAEPAPHNSAGSVN